MHWQTAVQSGPSHEPNFTGSPAVRPIGNPRVNVEAYVRKRGLCYHRGFKLHGSHMRQYLVASVISLAIEARPPRNPPAAEHGLSVRRIL